ncbi:MAG: hypothetical protein ACRC3Y_11925 [Romboutsia sp.]|uniref:hypothetical protein n=1 Tax=Romboutsia sp. TaxID=1965302 RepID=UPI003F417E9C
MAKNYLNKALEYEPYFKSLGRAEKDSEKLFSSMKDVYMLALVVGFKMGRKKIIKKSSADPIKLSIFDEHDKVIMDIIALYENIQEKDLSLLRSDMQEDKYKLIEEYTNGGMEIIIRDICNKGARLEDFKKFAETFNPNIDNTDSVVDILFGETLNM